MTMDYSPWVERENWPFLKVAISLKPERSRPSKLVHMHKASILTCINFLGRFRSIKFFDDHGLYSMLRKENLAIFKSSSIESSNISKTRGYAHQNWHTCIDINLYFHKFFELILFFDPMNNSPLSERHFNLKETKRSKSSTGCCFIMIFCQFVKL